MKRRWIFISFLVLISIIVYIGLFFFYSPDNKSGHISQKELRNPSNTNIVVTLEPPDTIYKIYPESSRLIFGDEDAIVKIILFADFSDSKSINAIKLVKEIVLQEKDVSLYIYSFPVYKNDYSIVLSNLFIQSVNKGRKDKFLEFVESNNVNDLQQITNFIERSGIDKDLIFAKYTEKDLAKLPALSDMNLGVNFGVSVPPVYFINGLRVDGLKPKDKILEIVKENFNRAEGLLKNGMEKKEIYNELVKNGKEVAFKLQVKDRVEDQNANNYTDNNIYEEDLRYVPLRGPRYAPVTIVLFVDYECPYTKRFYPILSSIMKRYEKDVRLFVKHYPISNHKRSDEVAKFLASALVQKKFWVLFDKIMEDPDFTDENKIYEISAGLGIDIEQLKSNKDSDRIKKYVENDKEKGSQLGIGVLPTIFINGVRYEGVISAAMLEKIIINEKKIAERLKDEGIKEEELYDNLVKRNRLKNIMNKGIKKPYIEKIR